MNLTGTAPQDTYQRLIQYDSVNNKLVNGLGEEITRLVVKGSGATSATSALNITNSADTSALFVRNDGNVGIGTTAPTRILDVSKNDNSRVAISLTNSNAGSSARTSIDLSSDY